MNTDAYRIKPGTNVVLPEISSSDTDGYDGKKTDAVERTDELSERLFDLQQVLFADNSRKVLVVLQAMDTGGKDGTIGHCFRGLNPEGCYVAAFKADRRRTRPRLPLARPPARPREGAHRGLQPLPL